jgi:hypothetical protein
MYLSIIFACEDSVYRLGLWRPRKFQQFCRISFVAKSRASQLLRVLMLGSALSVTTELNCQTLDQLDRALQSAGYQRYNPPRANWGPGFVFAGDIDNGRIRNVEEICPNLYDDVAEPQSTNIVLANYSANDSFSLSLAITFLRGLLGGKAKLVPLEKEDSVQVQWENIRELSYSRMHQWLESGEPRPIAKRCRLAIEDLKAKGLFKDRIFVIMRAVAPERLTYDFSRTTSAQGNASVAISPELEAAANGKIQVKDNTHLQTEQRLYIGYAPPAKVEEWLPANLLSGEIVGVRVSGTHLELEN